MNLRLPLIILSLLILAVLLLAIRLFLNPAAIFPDPSWGFQVMRSMQMGGGFNMLVTPDPANIALNSKEFLTWWSPGQYLLPYFFKLAFHINMGQAASVTTIFCQIIGLTGLYAFFRKAGFTLLVSVLSMLFICCQVAFFVPYIFYNGGETLLFALAGWFLYGCVSLNKPGIKLVLFVLLSGWIGFFCKSSFIWMYAAGLLFIWISISSDEKNIIGWVKKGFWPGIPAVISVGGIYVFYLSKGLNPASGSGGLKLHWETFTFPLASPLLSGFSADDLANGFIFHSDAPVFSYTATILVLILLAVASIWLVTAIYRTVAHKNYKLLLLVFYLVSVVFFSYAFLNQKAISFEGRHFRIIGLLIVPGTIYLFSTYGIRYRLLLGVVTATILFFTLKFYIPSYNRSQDENAHGVSGITQQFIDQPSLDYITVLDRNNSKAVFVFLSADLGLEIMHNRMITFEPLSNSLKFNFDEYVHYGHAGPLYILMPSNYTGIRASLLMKCFPGYKGFTLKELSDDYVLYYAK